jgi:hypothetical protein
VSLLRALGMPFQTTSVMFVGMVSILMSIALSLPGTNPVLAIFCLWFAISWSNKYAFALLDSAANGITKTPVASVEMLGPFGDWRAWVHPTLAATLALLSYWLGPPTGRLVAACGAMLIPASVVSIVMSGRIRDALNPFALVSALRGLGATYLVVLLATALFIVLAAVLLRSSQSVALRFAIGEFGLLSLTSLIGGVIHARRHDLNFEPIVSPERVAERAETERLEQRQRVVDEFYAAIRVREPTRAVASLDAWLAAGSGTRLALDVESMIGQAAKWPEQKGLLTLLRTVITHALRTRQSGLALATAEAGLERLPDFRPETAEQLEALATLARHSGRRRLAERFEALRPSK